MNRYATSERVCLVLTLFMFFGAWNSATAQSFPETIPLPTGFWPEGIAVGDGHTAYIGSLAGGSIYELDLRTGTGSFLFPGGQGLIAVGLDHDARSGYLFVAGGFGGDGRVYDTNTGEMIDQYFFNGGWVNDVVVTQGAAYFTDSFLPFIYKVPLTPQGAPSGTFYVLPLGPAWINIPTTDPSMPMINANGIVATSNNGTLIVVNYVLGLLYTVDPDTGLASAIDLGGVEVLFGDGLVLRGKTLYVVQNFFQNVPGQVSVFTLNSDYSAATLMKTLTNSEFETPATADLFGPWLYTTNPRFNECPPLQCDPSALDFNIVRIDQ